MTDPVRGLAGGVDWVIGPVRGLAGGVDWMIDPVRGLAGGVDWGDRSCKVLLPCSRLTVL